MAGTRTPKIFFLHNPKGGGSSLRSVFGRQFAPDAIAPVFHNAPNDHRPNDPAIERYRGFLFYAGHYGHEAFRRLQDGHQLVTNFRDPVARIVSLYRYWRNNVGPEALAGLDAKDAAVVMLSKQLEFGDFIRSENPDLRLYIDNFHFRQILHSGWQLAAIGPSTRIEVKRRIAQMPWFYIAEMPYKSRVLLKQAFPEFALGDIPRDNRSEGEDIAVEDADIRHLTRLNALDYEVYHHAVGIQQRRMLATAAAA